MTYKNFTLDIDADGIALLTWDMADKSMNVIDESVMDEIATFTAEIQANEEIKGAVIASGKKDSFSGGADLSMLEGSLKNYHQAKAKDEEAATKMLFEGASRLGQLYRDLETCGKPVVCAINGTCMGGALELALSCHARVASDHDKLRLALPEVQVGLLPGAGGTQRVARLAKDMQAGLQMLIQGQRLKALKAKAMGLINEVVPAEELVASAKQMIKDGLVDPVAPWDKKGFRAPSGKVYSPAGMQLWPAANGILRQQTAMNYPAAQYILSCVYEGSQVPIDTGLRIEARYFTAAMKSPQAGNMIRSLFLSKGELEKGARRPEGVPKTEIKKVGVIGAGFMGAGIAYVSAKAGINVVLIDQKQEAADKGKEHSDALMAKQVSRGRAKAEDKQALLDHILATTDYNELADCDLVIEAVFEDREVKRKVTEAVEAVISPTCIYASNTSTLPITGLAEASKRPSNFIGVHFFSPVDKMLLVELIVGEKTGDPALALALDYVRRIRKTPIVVNDTRGFYANRCVLNYVREGHLMLTEGIPAAMIENVAKMAGMPVGPLSLNDEIAIDLAQKIMKATVKDLGEKAVDPVLMTLVDDMVDKHGRLGRKNGKGFYDYPSKPAKKHLWPGLGDMYEQVADVDALDVQELKDRMLVAQALEAARVFEEGVLTDVREADVGSILGFGFAPWSGGTLSYIDMMGTPAFLALCKKLQKKHGPRFKPNKLIIEMAAKDEKFYQRFNPKGDAKKAA
ncbi:MAG: 3-hydroxyacyl-CoA dehydrogenase NAD-binding domain-containing protein [Hyphomicrobiales bacterium]